MGARSVRPPRPRETDAAVRVMRRQAWPAGRQALRLGGEERTIHVQKIAAGAPFPPIAVPQVGGGEMAPGAGSGWRLLVVYGARHRLPCKPHLGTLLDDFAASGVSVAAVSADPEEKAVAHRAEFGWCFPPGHGLAVGQMQAVGLHISTPRSPRETHRPFAEPARS